MFLLRVSFSGRTSVHRDRTAIDGRTRADERSAAGTFHACGRSGVRRRGGTPTYRCALHDTRRHAHKPAEPRGRAEAPHAGARTVPRRRDASEGRRPSLAPRHPALAPSRPLRRVRAFEIPKRGARICPSSTPRQAPLTCQSYPQAQSAQRGARASQRCLRAAQFKHRALCAGWSRGPACWEGKGSASAPMERRRRRLRFLCVGVFSACVRGRADGSAQRTALRDAQRATPRVWTADSCVCVSSAS